VKYALLKRLTISITLAALVLPLAAQTLPRASREMSWDKLSKPAGIIFAGTVLRIERVVTENSEPTTVRVEFRVDQAVRGCVAGQKVAIQEWAELWERGDRYRKGQRIFLFLYPPSEAGLTSVVAGDLGKVQFGPMGLLLTPQQAQFLSSQNDAVTSQPDISGLKNGILTNDVRLRVARSARTGSE
jgi:hypothetical protein